MNKEDIINFYLDNNILISPEIIDLLDNVPLPINSKFIVLNKDTLTLIKDNKQLIVEDFEKAIVLKEKNNNTKLYNKFLDYIKSSDYTKSDNVLKEDTKSILNNSTINTISSNVSASVIPNKAYSDSSNNLSNKVSDNKFNDIKNKIITETPPIISSSLSNDNYKDSEQELKDKFLKYNKIKIVSNYTTKTRKWSVQDFVKLYNARFKELEKILRARQELQSLTSISKISAKKDRENVALIGVVYDKATTKAGNIMLTIEDPTGMIKVVITKAKEDLFRLAEEIQLDETIGITGMFDQIIFVSNILLPDIPLTKELKKSPEEGYFVVISDTQVGSKLFLEKEFDKFLLWINGEIGSDVQREVASKVKYIFIGGDLVDGIGVYPNQEYDLNILDIKEQYHAFALLLKKIPEYMPIIFCPGNHDVGRISEPQPALTKEYAELLLTMPNVISLSNPSIVNIYAQPESGFDGFDVMFYHGYSFVYYSEHIPSIRKAGGQKRPDLIMKYLLQRRHLAPSHTSTYIFLIRNKIH
ncbi:MAG: metallophosphoesterase [Candidatus Woesearchaeota archaeon]